MSASSPASVPAVDTSLAGPPASGESLPIAPPAAGPLPIVGGTDQHATIPGRRESLAEGGAPKGQRPGSRIGIRRRMPAAVLRVLREKLVAAPCVTTEMAEALNREFGLQEKYKVVEPWHFLVRERRAEEEERFLATLKDVRRRQQRAARVLKKTVGKMGESDRQLWENGAYLKLVEMIYVRLMENKSELPTAELMALSKAMAEHRRVSAREPGATGKEAVGAGGELPEDFGEVVKQIYGTNFHAPS
jgi:ribosomal protein L7/L12